MNNRGNGNSFFWLFVLLIMFGGGTVVPLLFVLGIVLAITFAAVNSNRRQESISSGFRRPSYGSTVSSRGRYSASQMARINVYLRNWFRTRKSLPVGQSVSLRVHGERYASLASLDVYRNGTYISSLSEFGRRYPESYDEILKELIRLAENRGEPEVVYEGEYVEAEPVRPKEKKEQKKQETPSQAPKKSAQYFVDTINSLNNSIPDEDISNGLYETCALLKQIQQLEQRFPDSRGKLDKLYEYYLPILTRILAQYDNLQAAKTDPSYEETRVKLNRTIKLINDAMKTIISSMTDQDFMNLAADISTLEAVLQKDGLTSEGTFQESGLE
ncbi:MAG: hypothetical protein IKS37_09540 [Solobacterium sp.]|nr:hypothetical protein [Solobacterium sp.]